MSYKTWLIRGIVFLITILVFLGFLSVYTIPRQALQFEPTLILQDPGRQKFVSPLEWYQSCENNSDFAQGLYHMTLRLIDPKAAIRDDAWYCLVLPYVGGNAIRASLNGLLLGSQGDFDLGKSNIWNSIKVFPIPPQTLRKVNTVEIENFAVYDAGLVKSPYIVEYRKDAARISILRFLSETSIFIVFGGILILGFALIAIGTASMPRLNAKVLLGAAAIGTALFLTDFMTLPYLPVSLLAFKRSNAILRHVSVALFILGYLKLLNRKVDWFAKGLIVIQIICAVVLLFPATVIGLKNTYTYTYLSVLPFPVYLILLLLVVRKTGRGNLLLLSGVGVGTLCSLHDVLASFFWPNAVLISHYGFIVLTFTTFVFVVNDILQNYKQLMFEKNRAESYREASMHDPLTRVFNRNVLPLIRRELSGPFAAVILDLDDFKSINDEYGHFIGDLVLLDAAAILNRVLRRDDYVIRTGGDEFLAILPDCPKERVDSIVSKLNEHISRARIELLGNTMDGKSAQVFTKKDAVVLYSASVGVAYYPESTPPTEAQFQELINQADYELYSEKRRRLSE